jgi:hypothetical protein
MIGSTMCVCVWGGVCVYVCVCVHVQCHSPPMSFVVSRLSSMATQKAALHTGQRGVWVDRVGGKQLQLGIAS